MNFEDFRAHVRVTSHETDLTPRIFTGTIAYYVHVETNNRFLPGSNGMSVEESLNRTSFECERMLYKHVYGGSYIRLCTIRDALRTGQFDKADALLSAMLDDMVPSSADYWGMDRRAFFSSYEHYPKDWYKGETK